MQKYIIASFTIWKQTILPAKKEKSEKYDLKYKGLTI
jgi:hypothetical protein